MSGFRDDAPPWSFFIPIALAVLVGVLAADAIRYAVATVFAQHDEQLAETAQPAQSGIPKPAASPMVGDAETPPGSGSDDEANQSPVHDPSAEPAETSMLPQGGSPAASQPAATDAGPDEAGSTPAQPVSGALQALPGPLSARRDENDATCINGTVAYRSGNGWQQRLENDAPIRCTATSP